MCQRVCRAEPIRKLTESRCDLYVGMCDPGSLDSARRWEKISSCAVDSIHLLGHVLLPSWIRIVLTVRVVEEPLCTGPDAMIERMATRVGKTGCENARSQLHQTYGHLTV